MLKLREAGINTEWFSEYLSDREQRVKNDGGVLSDKCPDIWGVPQGSVMGPVLFSIFINYLPTIPKWCKVILYADDTTLIISCYPWEVFKTIELLEFDIANIIKWLNVNFLEINPSKTEVIVLGTPIKVKRIGTIRVKVGGLIIESQECVKILGCLIDNTLSFKNHVKFMTRKCYAQLSPLFTLRPVISEENMIILIKGLVFPHLNYMACVWGLACKDDLKSIERVIKTCARLVMKSSKQESITDKLNNVLKWMGPKQLFYSSILRFMYKLIKCDYGPELFKSMFKSNSDVHDHNTRFASNLHQGILPRLEYGKKCIEFLGAHLWTKYCSDSIDSYESYDKFRRVTKEFLLCNVDRV